MTKKEVINKHAPKNPDLKKVYKQNPPQVFEGLEWQPGEAIISELPAKDLIQLASRYINDLSVYVKNLLHFQLRLETELTWLLEAQGIDVKEKFKQDAKEKAELLAQQEKALKEQMEQYSK